MEKLKLAIAGILVALASYLIGGSSVPAKLGMTSRSQASCNVRVSTKAVVGNESSATILSAHPNRAWARIQQPANATNTVYLSFDEGASAVSGSGMFLTDGITVIGYASSTLDNVVFGLNTDMPYNGAVTGITNTGSTTVLVTECIF